MNAALDSDGGLAFRLGGGEARLLARFALRGETRPEGGLEYGLDDPEGGVMMVGVGVLEELLASILPNEDKVGFTTVDMRAGHVWMDYGGRAMANSEYAGLPLVFTCYLFLLDDLIWRRDHVGAPDTYKTISCYSVDLFFNYTCQLIIRNET